MNGAVKWEQVQGLELEWGLELGPGLELAPWAKGEYPEWGRSAQELGWGLGQAVIFRSAQSWRELPEAQG